MGKSLLEQAVKAIGPDALAAQLTTEQKAAMLYEWRIIGRPEQVAPDGDWRTWLILAGRGWGKTRTGAELVRAWVEREGAKRIALVAPTAADARDVMVEGESGVLAVCPPWNKPTYEPSKRRITWKNGAIATVYTADEPDRLRGPQHDRAWCDELAAWRYMEAWDMLQFGLRLGERPRVLVTTTPRPIPIIRDLMKLGSTVVTRGSTFDNAANLAAPALEALKHKYEGTRLGRQELHAEMLDDVAGALWTREIIDAKRISSVTNAFTRCVVGVDPSGSAKKTADEAGIVVAGIAPCRCLGRDDVHAFVMEDASDRYQPRDMAAKYVSLYHKWKADLVVAEDNFGGQIVKDLTALTDTTVAYKAVHASRGKIVRAEPVSALYEQGRVHHVGYLGKLEDEMCQYSSTPLDGQKSWSPGRLDALVWAITELMLGAAPATAGEGVPTPRRTEVQPSKDYDPFNDPDYDPYGSGGGFYR